jgi:hypothetical protein
VSKFIFVFIFLFTLFPLISLHYYSEKYYYSIDIPESWELADDSKVYNSFFRNENKNSFVEITAYNTNDIKSVESLFKNYIERYKMTGKNKGITFCRYNASKGEYNFNFKDVDLKMNMIIFKDKYFYYVLMAYTKENLYSKNKAELQKIIYSFKIYYDNKVVYGNDEPASVPEEAINKNVKVKEKSSKKYSFKMNCGNAEKNFNFLTDDYYSSVDELQKIISPSIWSYFGIDTNSDPDYNFTFWEKFYQEIFNKNNIRISDVVDFFKKETKKRNWDSYKLAENVIKSIQTIPYKRPFEVVTDKTRGENVLDFFTPNEIAWFGKGDCDTKSMFIIMILRQLGYDTNLYYSLSYNHAMVALNINANGYYKKYKNKKYYFVEATYPGWKIGDLPPEMKSLNKWKIIQIQ